MATPVNILIRAKDQASGVMKNVSKAGQGMTSTLKGMVGPIAAVAAGFVAWKSISGIVSGSIAAFQVQEKAVRDLTIAFEIYDGAVGDSMDQMTAFASELQVLTNVGDEQTLQLMKQARAMGVATDQLQGMTQSAIALAEVTGKGLKQSLETLAKAREGDTKAMERAFPALKNMTDEAEKQAYINEQLAKSFEIAKDGTSTMEGALTSIGNNWGDILETIGASFQPFITKLADAFNKIAPVVQNMFTAVVPLMESLATSVGYWITWLVESVMIPAWSAIETIWQEFPTVIELAVTSASLQIVKLGNTIKYYLLEVIWPYVKWFGENYVQIIKDTFSNVLTILTEAFSAYAEIFKRFWSWVFSGFKGGVGEFLGDVVNIGEEMASNIAEGLKNGAEQLPQIAARQMGPVEKELTDRVAKLGGKVGEAYAENLKKNQAAFGNLFADGTQPGAGEFQGLQFGGPGGAGGAAGAQQLAAVESRFLSGRGAGDPAKEALDETKKQTEQNASMIEYLASIAESVADSLGLGLVT